ncbi:hypothetical protein D9M71_648540 [compost metagenome]
MPIGIGRCMRMPSGPVSCTVPTGTCHTSLWVLRSMADMVPNGGFWHGMPTAERKRSRMAPNGVPSCGTTPISIPLAPALILSRGIM